MIRGQSEIIEDIIIVVCGRTETVLDSHELDRNTLQAKGFRDRAAQAADDAVLFYRDTALLYALCDLGDAFAAQRLDGRYVDNLNGDLSFQCLCSFKSLLDHNAAGKYCNVSPFLHDNGLTGLERNVFRCNKRKRVTGYTDVHGSFVRRHIFDHRCSLVGICRNEYAHVGKDAHVCDIIHGLVGGTVTEVRTACGGTADLHIQCH